MQCRVKRQREGVRVRSRLRPRNRGRRATTAAAEAAAAGQRQKLAAAMRAALPSVTEGVAADVREAEETPEVAVTEEAIRPFTLHSKQQLSQLQRLKYQHLHEEQHKTLHRQAGRTVEVAHREQQQEQWNRQGLQLLPHLWEQQRQWRQPVRGPAGRTQQQQVKPEQRFQQNHGCRHVEVCGPQQQQHDGGQLRQLHGRTLRGSGGRSGDLYSCIRDACIGCSSSEWPHALHSTSSFVIRFKQRRLHAARLLLSPLVFLILPFFLLGRPAGGTERSCSRGCWSLKEQTTRRPAVGVMTVTGFAQRPARVGGHASGIGEREARETRPAATVCKPEAFPRRLISGRATRGLRRAPATTAGATQGRKACSIQEAAYVGTPAAPAVATVEPGTVCTAQTLEKAANAAKRAAERAAGGLVAQTAVPLVQFMGTTSPRYIAVRKRSPSHSCSERPLCSKLLRTHNCRVFQTPSTSFYTTVPSTSTFSTCCFPRCVSSTLSSGISSAAYYFKLSFFPSPPSCCCPSLSSPLTSGSDSTAVRLLTPALYYLFPCCTTSLFRSLLHCSSSSSSSLSVSFRMTCSTAVSLARQSPRRKRRQLRFRAVRAMTATPFLPLAQSSRTCTWDIHRHRASRCPHAVSVPFRSITSISRCAPRLRRSCRTPGSMSQIPQYSSLPWFSHLPSVPLAYVPTYPASCGAPTPSLHSAVTASLRCLRSISHLSSSSDLWCCPLSRTSCFGSSLSRVPPRGATASQSVPFPAARSFHSSIPPCRLQGVYSPSVLSFVAFNRSACFPTLDPFFPSASSATFQHFSPCPRSCFTTSPPWISLFGVFRCDVARHVHPLASRVAFQDPFAFPLSCALQCCHQSSKVSTHISCSCRQFCPGASSAPASRRKDSIAADRAVVLTCSPALMKRLSLHSSSIRRCSVGDLLQAWKRQVFMSLLQTARLGAAEDRPTALDLPENPRALFSHAKNSDAADVSCLRGGGRQREGDVQDQRATNIALNTRNTEVGKREPTGLKQKVYMDPAEDGRVNRQTAPLTFAADELVDAKKNQATCASTYRTPKTGSSTCKLKEPPACSIGAAAAEEILTADRNTFVSVKVTKGENKTLSADKDEASSHARTISASLSAAFPARYRPVMSRRDIGERRRLDRRLNWFKQYPYAPKGPAVREKQAGEKATLLSSHDVSVSNSFLPIRRLPHSLRWETLAETPAPAAAAAAAAAAATQAAVDVLENSAVSAKQRKSKKRLKKRALARAAAAAATAAQQAPGSAALIAAARWLQSAHRQKSSNTEKARSASNTTVALNAEVAALPGGRAERESDIPTPSRSLLSPTVATPAATPAPSGKKGRGENPPAEEWMHQLVRKGQAGNSTSCVEHANFAEGSLLRKTDLAKQPHFSTGGSEKPAGIPQPSDVAGTDTQQCPSLLSLLYPSKHAAYPPELAFFVMKQLGTSKFNESVELHVQLNMGGGPRGKARMSGSTVGRVKGYVTLPHGEFGELAQISGSQQQHRQESGQTHTQMQLDRDRREDGAISRLQEQFPEDEGEVGYQPKRRKSAANAEVRRDQEHQPAHLYEETAGAEHQEIKDSARAGHRQEDQALEGKRQREHTLPSISERSIYVPAAGTALPDAIVKEESGVVRGRKRGGRWRRRRVIAAFVDKADEETALQAGADIVGSGKILSLIRDDEIHFDVLISTPDMVARLTRYGKILGPKDLLPQAAWGTLKADFCEAIRLYRQATVPYKSDKFNIVHMTIGHALMPTAHLVENLEAAIHSLYCSKPLSAGLNFLYKVHISSTMGPGILVDMKHVRLVAAGKQRIH